MTMSVLRIYHVGNQMDEKKRVRERERERERRYYVNAFSRTRVCNTGVGVKPIAIDERVQCLE